MKLRSLIGLTTSAIVLAAGLVAFAPSAAQPAAAANASQFDPGNLISDENFFNGNAMSAAEVQAFVQAQIGACYSSYACLNTFRQNTPTMSAVSGRCDAYVGRANESAADIIARVGQACGISQKAMLVLLEKEQGLVSSNNPNQRRFDAATGMGCPDTAGCDPSFGGFFYQVYFAARQFKAYAGSPNSWNHIAGRVNNIRFHPDASCGSSPVYIANQATAGLYNYTPYQPNGAALANLYGTGDGCSAYGNRNFWRIYTDWFGSPTQAPNPIGSVDGFIVASSSSTGAQLRIGGWVIDNTQPSVSIPAHVYITYPSGAVIGWPLKADQNRPDVAAAYPNAGAKHGYGLNIDVNRGGTYQACVYGIGKSTNRLLECKTLVVPQNAPTSSLDKVWVTGKSSSTAISVAGWAFDKDLPNTAIPVHIYITKPNGQTVGTPITADKSRPDVAAMYGVGPNHGFQASFPVTDGGTYNVCTYAIGTYWTNIDINPQMGCVSLNIVKDFPLGSYDSLTVDRSGSQAFLNASGWAFDRGASETSIPVHLYVTDPQGKTTNSPVVADRPRADVNAAFGITGNHGFGLSLPITVPGTYKVCPYGIAISPLSIDMNAAYGCKTVTVAVQAPIGSLDTARIATQGDGSQRLTVTGWSIDQQVPTKPISVHVYVTAPDGTIKFQNVTADQTRTDVGAAFPGTGQSHGYSASIDINQPGKYSVCTYGIGQAALNVGMNSQLGCVSVTN